mgnify:CR=1 FL=1
MQKSPYRKTLEAKIEQIERRMAHEWRLFQRYSEALVRLKLRLQIMLNNEAALCRKKVVERSRQIFGYLEDAGRALRDANYFAFLRIHRPRTYDWGVIDHMDVID